MEHVCAIDDQVQLLVVDKRSAGVDIGDHSDPETVQLARPVVDRDRLLAHDQPVRLDEESPKDDEGKQQHNSAEKNSESLGPNRSATPLGRAWRTPDFPNEKQQQPQYDGNGNYEGDSHAA